MPSTKTAEKNGALQELGTALSEALSRLGKKHKVAFELSGLNINGRGKVTARVAGTPVESKKNGAAAATAAGLTSSERRFRLFHTEAKLPLKALHATYQVNGDTYEVVGLRGQRNKVVLRDAAGEEFLMENAEFRKEARPAA